MVYMSLILIVITFTNEKEDKINRHICNSHLPQHEPKIAKEPYLQK